MKKILLTVILIVLGAGVCIAATYKIKSSGTIVSPNNQKSQTETETKKYKTFTIL